MPPEKGDAAYLWDMLDAARSVRDFTTGRSFQEYLRDQMLRRAVERSLEIIGEAAGRVSDALEERASRNSVAPNHRAATCHCL